MTSFQQLPGERTPWQMMLNTIQRLMAEALSKLSISMDNVQWVERRWDIQDITASWPKDRPRRNIHAWIRGTWPRFFIEVEGSVWEDDEEKLQRHIRFFPFPGRAGTHPGIIAISGPASDPVISILNGDDLSNGLIKLAGDLQTARLTNAIFTYPLRPDPRRTQA